MQQPLVSVILPTFGRLRYLRPTVASLYGQTLADWELVVADDGSDEETRAYLRALAREPRVKVVWLPHCGIPAVVRNAALRAATGEYVAFLDSDDLWTPQKLARQIEALRARGACRWSYTGVSHIDGDDRTLADDVCGPWVPCDGSVFERLVTGPVAIRTPTVLAMRALIEQVGGFDEAIRSAEDYDLWLRLALASEVVLIDEQLVKVRRHEDNHTRNWEIAFVGRDYSLRKLEATVGPRMRSLLRKERTRNALTLAATHAALGNHRRMLHALWHSLPYSFGSPRWWFGLVKTPLRPYVPRRIVDAYRRYKRGYAP
jgi:glycosyltransferase involved in cell wall biosynthesis